MSGYYDDDEPRRHRSHRSSRRPVYEEEVIEARSSRPNRQTELVRRRDSSESVEEVRRDFPPGDGAYVQRRTTTRDKYAPPRARSVGRDDYYYQESYYSGDPRRSDGAVSGARYKRSERRRGRYDSDSESESRSPPSRQRRKSLGEQALAAVGLGGAAAALTGRSKDRDRSRSRARSRSRRRYDSRSPSRDRSEDGKKKFQQAAKAAITAGAIEAWRTRKEPGGFAGNGKRVLTAAIGAAGINGAMDRDPEKHKTRHTIEAALGGLAGNRLINGARESSRSRSRGRGPEKESNIGGIASAAGLAALAGKAFNDYRSKSRNRRNSFESDSRSQSPSRRKRSKSVTDYLRSGVDAGLAKLGLGDSENHHPKYGKDKFGRRHYDDDDDYNPRPRGGGGEEEHHGSDTDSYDSDEEISKQKKMRGKEFLTAGLATVATIHAAHSVHGSIQARKKNRREVMEGKMSPEEARKKKSKALLQEAAAIGIATLGIKGAVSEWKEVNEKRKECHEAKTRLAEKREHRRIKLSRQQSERSSEPNLGKRYQYDDDRGRYDDRGQYDDRGRYDDRGPRYYDDNPYSSGGLPPPPIGSARF